MYQEMGLQEGEGESRIDEMAKKPWSRGLMVWLFVGNVFLVATVFSLGDLDRFTVHFILYQIDFHHWPLSLGIALWLLFAWLVLDAVTFHCQPVTSRETAKTLQSFRLGIHIAKWFAFIGIPFFLTFAFFSWQRIWQWFYFALLMQYYIEPMALFFYDGTVTIRLIFPPLTGVTVIGFLLCLNHIFKKRTAK